MGLDHVVYLNGLANENWKQPLQDAVLCKGDPKIPPDPSWAMPACAAKSRGRGWRSEVEQPLHATCRPWAPNRTPAEMRSDNWQWRSQGSQVECWRSIAKSEIYLARTIDRTLTTWHQSHKRRNEQINQPGKWGVPISWVPLTICFLIDQNHFWMIGNPHIKNVHGPIPKKKTWHEHITAVPATKVGHG